MAPRPVKRPPPRPRPDSRTARIAATPLIHGRNAVLEAARAGRGVKV